MKLSTRIWLGIGAATVVLAAIPFLLPLDTYRGPIERAATNALGRQVRIKGPLHLAVWPEIGISLSDVTLANTPEARDSEMVSIGSVLVGAEVMPLISSRLEVTEIVLQKPVIHLEVQKDGTPNWRLTQTKANGPKSGEKGRGPNAPAPAAAPANGTSAPGFNFRTVTLDDGEVSYFDAATNATEALHDVSVKLTLQGSRGPQPLAAPLNLDGAVTYNGEPLKINGKVDRFSALLNGQPTGLHVSVSSNIINADFTGSLGTDGISGALKMGAHSVRSFAAWAGHPMPEGNGFGLMAMEGQFSAHDGLYKLNHSHLAFDSMSLNTDITIDTNPDRLAIKGLITIDKLDVSPYLAAGKEPDTVKAKAKAKTAGPDAPLELGWLKAADADLKLVLGGLVLPDVKLDQAVVDFALKDGVVKAVLNNVTAYGGMGKATLTFDASAAVPALHETLDLNGLNAHAFLSDVFGVERISGVGALHTDLTARGLSRKALLQTLNGKGSIKFSDGAISGADLAEVARLLQSVLTAQVLTGAVGDNAKTAFGQMGGSFTVQNGVVRTNDLTLVSPELQMNAKGSANLLERTIDFYFEPKAKKEIPGLNLVDIGIPFTAKGPWDHPNYAPDAGGIAKSVVQRLGQDARLPLDVVKDPAGTLRSFFGGGKSK